MENLDQIFNPESNSFWNLLLAIVAVGASVFIARYARRVIRCKLSEYEGVDEYAGSMLGRVVGWIIVLLGIVLALAILGVDMVPVVLVLGLIAILLVLSARSLVENWAAGLLLQARAPYRPGDRIETLDYVGDVELTNLRSVVLREPDGQVVHVPNADVLKNPMVNQTGDDAGRRSTLDFGVAYGTDLEAAAEMVIQSAAAVPGVRMEPAPTAWAASMGDTTITLRLRFWTSYSDRNTVPSAVIRGALADLDAAGVAMSFSTQELRISGEIATNSPERSDS